MNSPPQPAPLLRLTLLGAGLVVIAAGLHAAASTVNIVLVSFLIAMTIYPIPHLLNQRGMPRGPAILLTIALVLACGALLIAGLGAALSHMTEKLPTYEAGLSTATANLTARLAERGIALSDVMKPDPQKVVAFVGRLARGALSGLGYGLLVLIIAAMALSEMPLVRDKNTRFSASFAARSAEVATRVRRFVGIQGLLGAGQGVVNGIAMVALGTDFPLVWAVLCFLLSFVPFGGLISVIPPLVLTLLEHGSTRSIILFAVFFVSNVLSDNVVKPKVMGEGLGISPLVIMISFLVWAYILGPMGALLAVPITIAIHHTLPLLTGSEEK